MKRNLLSTLSLCGLVCLTLVCFTSWTAAQQSATAAATTSSAVPNLINYSGVLKAASGSTSSLTGVTFLLYKDEQGGAPLWMETQNVTPSRTGHYTVQLGAASANGVPSELFQTGEARWLAVQIASEAEQPRVLLVAVPYAMKAADAATVGGLPPSAFVLLAPAVGGGSSALANQNAAASAAAGAPAATSNVTTTGGTVNALPLWTTATNIQSSAVTQTGTGVTAKIGIGTTSPAATLDVNGKSDIRDTLTLFPKSTDMTLAVNGTAFNIGNTGSVTFIAGQKFPGAGTITGITTASGSGLSGGGTTGTLSLKVPSAGITNAMLSNSKVTLNANTAGGLTAPGAMTLGSTFTIGLKPCTANQILQYSGSAWNCANAGTGTVTSVGLAAPASDFTVSGSPVTTSGMLNFAWTVAPTSADTANAIVKRDASGNFSGGTVSAAILTASDASLSNSLSIGTTSNGLPVLVSSDAPGATVIVGDAIATTGQSWGVAGDTESSASNAYGVVGLANSSTGDPIGVYGNALNSTTGIGVFGQNGSESSLATSLAGFEGAGTWGDTGTSGGVGVGVIGTADDGYAGYFTNNSIGGIEALRVVAQNARSYMFVAHNSATGGDCAIDPGGNLSCTGVKNAVVPMDGGKRMVAMSAIESPQVWFEDFGSMQLVNGVAVVTLDPDFMQTVNTEVDYKVFPVPNGDCKGLYVTKKTANTFEVRELSGGTSSVTFDYRITAVRKNYENVRFADHTTDFEAHKRMMARLHTPGVSSPASHMPTKKIEPTRPLARKTAGK